MNLQTFRIVLAFFISMATAIGFTSTYAFADLTAGEIATQESPAAPSTQEQEPLAVGSPSRGTEVEVDSWETLQEAINIGENNRVIKLKSDVKNTRNKDRIEVKENRIVTIDLNGHTLDRNLTSKKSNGHVIEVFQDAQLTIKDSSEGKTGRITGGYSKYGGGIYVNNDATLNFVSGTITGNNAVSEGGGIYVKGILYMSGGSIESNNAGSEGGGIYVDGTLNMTGGTITGNAASSNGGGIYVTSEGTITQIKSATITNNSANEYGGGICTYSSKATTTIENSSITENKSRKHGGGLYMDSRDKSLTIANTYVERNSSSGGYGGGIFLQYGSIAMSGSNEHPCTLSGNTAKNGGGIKVTSGTSFTASNVEISNNTANDGEGGGVKNYGTTSLANCTVSGNSAVKQGGGLYNSAYGDSAGELSLDYCTIYANSSESDGGGIYSNKKLKIDGGTIGKISSGNNGDAAGNSAAERGNGIFVDDDSGFTEIKGNLVVDGNSTAISNQEVYFNTNLCFSLSGKLAQGAKIGVTLLYGTGKFTLFESPFYA